MRTRRWMVALAGTAVVLAGCRVPGQWFPGHGTAAPSGVHVVAPANATQAPASGEVPLDVRLDVRPRRLHAAGVDRGGLARPHRHDRHQRTRSRATRTGATATIHAADLHPGLTTIKARAARTNGHGNETGYASFSWEPAVDTATAQRCDPIAARKCLMPFPNDFFTVADPTSGTGRRVALRPSRHAVELVGGLDRSHRVEPQRRLQPRRHDRHLRARARPGEDGRRADHGHRRVARCRPADRPARRDHRRAVADLVRARRAGRPGRRARARSCGSRRISPRATGSSWRCATCAPAAVHRSRPSVASSSTATRSPRSPAPSRRAARHFEQIFTTLEHAGHRTGEPRPGVGLHRRQRAEHRRPDAPHP